MYVGMYICPHWSFSKLLDAIHAGGCQKHQHTRNDQEAVSLRPVQEWGLTWQQVRPSLQGAPDISVGHTELEADLVIPMWAVVSATAHRPHSQHSLTCLHTELQQY